MNLKGNWPEGFEAWKHLSDVVLGAGLEPQLLNLVMMRASQINGCASCLDMHSTDAVSAGEDPRRLHVLPAWRDVSWFSARERAALALTESVTRIGEGRTVPDDVIAEADSVLGKDGAAKLLLAIVVINGWNRINITGHAAPRRGPSLSAHS